MTNHGTTRSTVKPEAIQVDEFSVWAATNITPIEESDGEQEFSGWEFQLTQYDKDEYIQVMAQQTAEVTDVINTLLGVNSNGQ
jgi:hypothetical protein